MGYSFYIGEAVPFFDEEGLYATYDVNVVRLDEAPSFPNDNFSNNCNCRSPSYSGWADFAKTVGLEELFDRRGENTLIECHPGIMRITQTHVDIVSKALERYKTIATKPPGCSGDFFVDDGQYDYNYARLIWLDWWLRWALENCKNPAFRNT